MMGREFIVRWQSRLKLCTVSFASVTVAAILWMLRGRPRRGATWQPSIQNSWRHDKTLSVLPLLIAVTVGCTASFMAFAFYDNKEVERSDVAARWQDSRTEKNRFTVRVGKSAAHGFQLAQRSSIETTPRHRPFQSNGLR